ncbi:MAG: glycosyltransferase family 4 protein [Verrucomicrobiaceae bacterium]|nr:glycosyltransferase family 4 protein [Verrucomicrobiaceae bacterium]
MHTRFHPNFGGIETVALLLAQEWQKSGEQVTVVTDVAHDPARHVDFPFPVHHRPGPLQWLRLLRETDVFVHMNISLWAFWPLLLVRRPFVAVNHAYYHSNDEGEIFWREKLKRWLMKFAQANIAVSQAVERVLGKQDAVIANPVDLSLFENDRTSPRTRELAFLGRLVSHKGCDVLLRALSKLGAQGLRPKLTIIGKGPEREVLEKLVTELDLGAQVTFAGAPPSEEVRAILNQHQIMVVPSVWEESFGVVALEGEACGCVVVASHAGGLPEAVGPAGMTFKRGDVDDLAEKLRWLLEDKNRLKPFLEANPAHLALHHPKAVAERYLEVFRKVVK